jgi:probable HAF family extracellular repeat protein
MKTTHGFKVRSFVLIVALGTSLAFLSPASAQYRSYIVDLNSKQVTELGSLGGGSTYATAINDAGQVAGTSSTGASANDGFITGPNGVGMTDLGALDSVNGINAVGQVVGYSNMPQRALITGPNGANIALLETRGAIFSGANSINNPGQVVGYSTTATSIVSHAFITGPNGVGITDLGTLGGVYSWAYGINNPGQVAGQSETAAGQYHAFITGPNGVGMTDLGTLGGVNSGANSINDTGQVAGQSETAAGQLHAFITSPNGVGMTDLGTLGGNYTESSARGISNAGQVVGMSYFDTMPDGAHHEHAFITGPNGEGMTDLNSLVKLPDGVVLTDARGINNVDQVVAVGITSAIPEPEPYALMLAGLVLVGFMTGSKRKIDYRTAGISPR